MEYTENIRAYRERATAEDVRNGRAWYPGQTAVMTAHAADTGLSVAQCAAVYAANSINTPWARNISLASGALSDIAAGLAPYANGGTLGMIIGKVQAIIATSDENMLDGILSADPKNLKIVNFRRNLQGDYSGVTVDRWAFRIATNFADCEFGGTAPCSRNKKTGKLLGKGHGCGKVPTGTEYEAIADAYMSIAAEYGEAPAASQAVTWIVVRGTGE